MIEELIIFSFLGVFVGLVAGMFGIGGGTLIVPVLVASFLNHGFQEDITVHLAIGSSMASIFFTGIASANAHRKKRAINFDILKPVTYGIIFGAFLGAIFALQLEGYVLKLIIACSMITDITESTSWYIRYQLLLGVNLDNACRANS